MLIVHCFLNSIGDYARSNGKIIKLTVPMGKMAIVIPDMFVPLLGTAPKVNPHYEQVKLESENWIFE